MQIADSVALVTGAGRGLGRHFATQLLERGAAKVYAAARRPESVDVPGVEVLPLDITDPKSVAAAAAAAGDVTLLVNNAGIATFTDLVIGDMDRIRLEMETNYFGLLNMVRAFAPVLRAGGGGALVNMLSVASWVGGEHAGAYNTAKAAAWSLTNCVRLELAAQNTLVSGVVLGPTDTDMMAGMELPKNDPAAAVRTVLDEVEAGRTEILVDEFAAMAKTALSLDPADVRPPAVQEA
ncbi:SDR family NAD(P)-dependent oxidoreductase OS=Streptomyces alboniger OX=132473 GN=CP975_17795 PE=3 SV=1 [Streptomyces alboniger]|uniref:SDR family oxidoreductase n=2 Tax=Streptomyces TaxID=1883 RepID=UPI0004CBB215|nr:SDR family oxidoreductase [Streptomyces canus]WSD86837.1 SDR family oxidoreductase [Streptomyces canus]